MIKRGQKILLGKDRQTHTRVKQYPLSPSEQGCKYCKPIFSAYKTFLKIIKPFSLPIFFYNQAVKLSAANNSNTGKLSQI